MHAFAVEVDGARGLKQQRGDPPARLGSPVAVEIAAPQEAVRGVVVVAVPRIDVAQGAGRIAAFKGDHHVAYMVAGRGEGVAEPDCYRAGQLCPADIRCVWVVIDDRVGRENLGGAVGVVAVEAFTVAVDQLGDRLAVDKFVYGVFQFHEGSCTRPRIVSDSFRGIKRDAAPGQGLQTTVGAI